MFHCHITKYYYLRIRPESVLLKKARCLVSPKVGNAVILAVVTEVMTGSCWLGYFRLFVNVFSCDTLTNKLFFYLSLLSFTSTSSPSRYLSSSKR